MNPAELASAIFAHGSRTFAVELWDGTVFAPEHDAVPGSRVVLRRPEVVSLFLPPSSERRLAEAYMTGGLALEGDLCGLLEAAAEWQGPSRLGPTALLSAWLARARSPHEPSPLRGSAHNPGRDREAIRRHYDRGAELCRLFLDRSQTYSCAYYPSGRESLDEAQAAKHELICRKLDLKAGDEVLDIGCGWGGFMLYAWSRHGARVVGTTLSDDQLEYVQQAIVARAPESELGVRLMDYRQLGSSPSFDKIVSVGMMEHVGSKPLGGYFAAAYEALRPGGLFLNHAIARLPGPRSTVPWLGQRDGGFIGTHIFPDGELLPIHEVVTVAERAGFEVLDLESLREHYELTLEHWLRRLQGTYDEAVRLVGAELTRAFLLYLGSSAVAFRLGRIGVFQLLLAKRDQHGRAEGLPSCRGVWYPLLANAAEDRRLPMARAG